MTLSAPSGHANGLCFDPVHAVRHLTAADPGLAWVIRRAEPFDMRPERTQSLFAALLESIVYQQLSGRAAETILGRVNALFAPRRYPTAEDLLRITEVELRSAGLSRNKTAALHDLARRVIDGTVPPLRVARRLSDDELVERLTTVHGVGRWTVEMLLIFRLGRPDVLPVGDYGVRKGYGLTFRRGGMPTATAVARRGARWAPFRSVASWYLWRALEPRA